MNVKTDIGKDVNSPSRSLPGPLASATEGFAAVTALKMPLIKDADAGSDSGANH